MVGIKTIKIEVAFALPNRQQILPLEVAEGTTIEQAIYQSGIMNLFPEIDLSKQKVGIFSQLRSLDHVLHEGDRVEIYRPLSRDPKEARRARVSGRYAPNGRHQKRKPLS